MAGVVTVQQMFWRGQAYEPAMNLAHGTIAEWLLVSGDHCCSINARASVSGIAFRSRW